MATVDLDRLKRLFEIKQNDPSYENFENYVEALTRVAPALIHRVEQLTIALKYYETRCYDSLYESDSQIQFVAEQALKEEPDSHPPGTWPEKDADGNILAIEPWARRER